MPAPSPNDAERPAATCSSIRRDSSLITDETRPVAAAALHTVLSPARSMALPARGAGSAPRGAGTIPGLMFRSLNLLVLIVCQTCQRPFCAAGLRLLTASPESRRGCVLRGAPRSCASSWPESSALLSSALSPRRVARWRPTWSRSSASCAPSRGKRSRWSTPRARATASGCAAPRRAPSRRLSRCVRARRRRWRRATPPRPRRRMVARTRKTPALALAAGARRALPAAALGRPPMRTLPLWRPWATTTPARGARLPPARGTCRYVALLLAASGFGVASRGRAQSGQLGLPRAGAPPRSEGGAPRPERGAGGRKRIKGGAGSRRGRAGRSEGRKGGGDACLGRGAL